MPFTTHAPTNSNIQGASNGSRMAEIIAGASARTGVDFDYMLAQARIESALDPAARARTSSAAGLYQFTRQTWLATLHKHGEAHGYGWASSAISGRGGRLTVADPMLRQEVMDLRFDPQAASLMAGELARDNAAHLLPVLGREPDGGELYLAHFLGAGGAARFLAALEHNPNQSAAALLPEAADANAAIFRTGGRDRSVAEVAALMDAKLARAGAEPGMVMPHRQDFAAAHHPQAPAPFLPGRTAYNASARPTMTAVLAATFGGSDQGGRAGAHVAAAYARLAGAGL